MDWKDITVGQYDELSQIENTEGTEFAENAVRILFGKSYWDTPYIEMASLLRKLDFIRKKPKATPHSKRYFINGTEYVLDERVEKMSVSQYMDFTAMAKANSKLSLILSCVLIPKGKVYNQGYDIEKAREDVSSIPVTEAISILSFFLNLSRNYIRALRCCLRLSKPKGWKRMSELMRKAQEM